MPRSPPRLRRALAARCGVSSAQAQGHAAADVITQRAGGRGLAESGGVCAAGDDVTRRWGRLGRARSGLGVGSSARWFRSPAPSPGRWGRAEAAKTALPCRRGGEPSCRLL